METKLKMSDEQKGFLLNNEDFMDVFRELSGKRFPSTETPAISEVMFATMDFAINHVNEFMDFLGESGDGSWDYLKWRLEKDFGIGAKFKDE